ncbi:rhodanese-like domain-containing protein [Mesoterricola silvestris]|uniref:Rhodanese domain-containing protein n=1 Tax=Mesoterricola silvestris TaxID=2927979 RepID=A0AA48KA45_9BACT|nr:rhodanese-like domain-containing protein [Mesoterricola silvestris]BDU71153.1 hypothetical protein METEAL_03270 [Mesoterricola silvestris]
MGDFDQLKAAGAQLVDVRTPAEFGQGSVPGSVNIPLDQLQLRVAEIDPRIPVIVFCASGGRSAMAKQFLEREGCSEVHNAGPWTNLL